jgi:Putative peptidoglycan binding domain
VRAELRAKLAVKLGARAVGKWSAIAACLALACAPAFATKHPSAKASHSTGDASSHSATSTGHSSTSKSTSGKSTSAHAKKSGKKKPTSTKFVPKQKVPTPERISEIQSALSRGSYYTGDPNGKWDADTISAMQKFQSANGIDPTGKLDAPTLQKLGLGSDIAGVSAPRPLTPASSQSVAPPESPRSTGSAPSS